MVHPLRSMRAYVALHRAPMTARAKAYLWITALRTMPIALSLIFSAHLYRGPAWTYITGAVSTDVWAVALLASVVVSVIAATTRIEWIARVALILSASLAMCWVVGFLLAFAKGYLLSPVGIMWGIGIAAKDLVVCRQPLWSPFEPLVERLRLRDAARGRS